MAAVPLSLPFFVELLGQQTSITSHSELEREREAHSAHLASGP